MAYTGSFDWNKFLAPQPNQEQENEMGLELLRRQLGIEGEAALNLQKNERQVEELLSRITSNPDWNEGKYEYTEKDMRNWYDGKETKALKTAKLVKQYADVLGIPLEQFDPDNPLLNPMFADNKYDAQRVMENFEKEIPNEFRVAYQPEKGIVRNLAASILGVGQNVAQANTYEKSKEAAINAMMEQGLSGKQIENILAANQAYQQYDRSPIERLLNISDNDGMYGSNFSGGEYKKGNLGSLYGQTATKDDVVQNFEKQYPDIAKMFKKATAPQTFEDASKNPNQWYNEQFKK